MSGTKREKKIVTSLAVDFTDSAIPAQRHIYPPPRFTPKPINDALTKFASVIRRRVVTFNNVGKIYALTTARDARNFSVFRSNHGDSKTDFRLGNNSVFFPRIFSEILGRVV